MVKHLLLPKTMKFVMLSIIASLIVVFGFQPNSIEALLYAVFSGKIPDANEIYIPVILRSMPIMLGITSFGNLFYLEKNSVTILAFFRYPSRWNWLLHQILVAALATLISINSGIFSSLLIGLFSYQSGSLMNCILLILRMNASYVFGAIWFVLLSNTLCLFISSKVSAAISICGFFISDIFSSSSFSFFRWSLPSSYLQPELFEGKTIAFPFAFFIMATALLIVISRYRLAKLNNI